MARIAGVDLPKEKRIEIALTYLYGIGPSRSRLILENTGVDPDRRAVDLTDDDVNKLRQEIEGNYKVEGALRTEVSHEYQASHGHRLLPGCPASTRPSRPGAAHPHECSDPQGPATGDRREEGGAEEVGWGAFRVRGEVSDKR